MALARMGKNDIKRCLNGNNSNAAFANTFRFYFQNSSSVFVILLRIHLNDMTMLAEKKKAFNKMVIDVVEKKYKSVVVLTHTLTPLDSCKWNETKLWLEKRSADMNNVVSARKKVEDRFISGTTKKENIKTIHFQIDLKAWLFLQFFAFI